MRTRFLATDFFNTAASGTLDEFLRLPEPVIASPPPSISSSGDNNFFRLLGEDNVSVLNLSSQLPSVHIDGALWKFFDDVLPHHVEVDQCCFSNYCSDQEETGTTMDGKGDNLFAILKFEMPELDLSLESACAAQRQEMNIFSEVPDAETSEDLLIPILKGQDLCNIQKSLFSVENIYVEYQMDQSNYLLEDSGSYTGQTYPCFSKFPLLEVDVSSLEIFSSVFVYDEIKLFESIEPQHCMADETMFDGKELLHFMELDILEYLLCSSLSNQSLEADSVCSHFTLEIDLFSVIEYELVVENSELYQGRPKNNYSCLLIPMLYEEQQFFNKLSFQILEIFSDIEAFSEVESSQQMFCEALAVNNFNELIVSHELTLVDETFKSLPVPMLSCLEKNSSVQEYLEEILAELKPQPSLASDAIYLDWHLIEEGKCNSSIYSSCLRVVEELGSSTSDFNQKLSDAEVLIRDAIFCDNNEYIPNRREDREMLKITSCDTFVAPLGLEDISGSMLKDGCQQRIKGGSQCNFNSDKIPKLVKSASDLYNLETANCSEYRKDGDPQSGLNLGENNQKLEGLMNCVPSNEYKMGSPRAANCFKPLSMPLPLRPQLDTETAQVIPKMSSFPDAVVVVNTQSVDNEMIISRRSTYQKILAMEKEGTQVVERDLHHPVDVVVTAAVCLVWYDCKNIHKKATGLNEVSSSLPSCIEDIAANSLTSLSFGFSSCIMVFEGQSSFLSGVMESSDELYAAAASLGMDLQLFFSHSCEMTDEIILSSILYAFKFTRGLYPRMPESESLAESFLTLFPSLNPLSAHAILSSVDMLIEFFEWSHTDRIHAIQRYQVSDESIALLNACFRYGEREDCKSGTTECSSSVSSAPDSDICQYKSASEMRKRKHIRSTLGDDMPMNELFHLDTSILYAEGRGTPKRMSKTNKIWLSEDPDTLNEDGKSSKPFDDDLFPQKPGSKVNIKETPSHMSKPLGFYMSEGRVMSDERDNRLPMDDRMFCQDRVLDTGTSNKFDTGTSNKFDSWNSMNSENFIQNFIGEVINIDDEHPLVEDSSFPDLSYLKSNMERDPPVGCSNTSRKLSFDNGSLPTFPRAAEINYDTDALISATSDREILGGQQHSREPVFQKSDKKINNEKRKLLEHQKYLFKDDTLPTSVESSYKYSLMENNMPLYGGTPLSNAINFAQPHQGSPWTIEFLNRVREKSKLRQKALPQDLSGPSFGYSGNISKVTKRRSPSILEFFKYQKESNPNKTIERKRQKRTSKPSNAHNSEKTLPSSLPAMTPIDKRARQTLSFATMGSGGQSKLVWGDKGTNALKRQFELYK